MSQSSRTSIKRTEFRLTSKHDNSRGQLSTPSFQNPCTSKPPTRMRKLVNNSLLYQNNENFFYPHYNRRLQMIGKSTSFFQEGEEEEERQPQAQPYIQIKNLPSLNDSRRVYKSQPSLSQRLRKQSTRKICDLYLEHSLLKNL